MRTIRELVRPNIRSLKPFSSAREEYRGAADIFLDANENPFNTIHNRYPDPSHKDLRKSIAAWRKVDFNSILLGNGSDEIIDLIIRTFCKPGHDCIRIVSPTFGMYQVSADINNVGYEEILLDENFDIDVKACLVNQTPKQKILFLCSPNNPTGNDLSRERITEVIKGWDGIVVVDEAYIDFSKQRSLLFDLNEFSNLVVLQTFSKALGAAGLRIGMCFSTPEIIKYLIKVKPPYNIGMQSQLSAMSILDNLDRSHSQVELICKERERVSKKIRLIHGVEHIFPSSSNFLLVRCMSHLKLKEYLQSKGIIVRDRSKLESCASCLRFTIGLPDENEMLIKEVGNYYKR